MNKDSFSNFFSSSFQILLIKYPTRTGLGVVLGYFFAFLIRIFEPTLKKIEFINLHEAPFWGWIVFGLLVMHIPTIYHSFTRPSVGDSSIDKVLELIDTGNFSETEKRKHRRDLIASVSKNAGASIESSRSRSKKTPKVTAVQTQTFNQSDKD